MMNCRSKNGFTLCDLLITVAVIALIIGLILPWLGSARRTARSMSNNTQVRGIQQGFVTYAQSNKLPGQDGYFPGLDSTGNIIPDGDATGHSGSGAHPAARMWMMLDGNYFTPDYMICPADERAVELPRPEESQPIAPVQVENYSYAVLGVMGSANETLEWSETLNTKAIVLSARAIGTGPGDISSVWTDLGSGEWRGGVARNDNSTSYESTHVFNDTQYGDGEVNAVDDLFADEPGADDAYLVHEDAVTAYNAK